MSKGKLEFPPCNGAKDREWWQMVSPETIKAYVAAGADVNVRNIFDETPMHLAVKFNRNPDVVKVLVENGADLNAKDRHGNTPAHGAAQYADMKICQIIVAAGADLTMLDRHRNSPADLAYLFGRLDVFQFLVDNGGATDDDLMAEKERLDNAKGLTM